jgi:tetratricopeptide (TPR) repeat protein
VPAVVLDVIDDAIYHARRLLAHGNEAAARQVYLDALRVDPRHPVALTELGALAHAGGYLSAAREAYHQAVLCNPEYTVARVGYGDLLCEADDPAAACVHYQAALAVDPDLPRAHQGLARARYALGEEAGANWQKGFVGHAVVRRRYRGAGAGIPLLLLVSAIGGNIPVRHWIDDRIYTVTAVYADFFDLADPLPPHALVVNAIGDADLCEAALANAERIVAQSTAPVINAPALVRATGREAIARRLGGIPGVIAPVVARLSQADLRFPILLRAPGYHTGRHFVRVETAEALGEAVASLPGSDPLAIEYIDARGSDGMARKYRVMFIDGAVYPLHLAISSDWKVHYFSAAMAAEPVLRAEEDRFLNDMPAVVDERGMAALAGIQAAMGLDYGGVDFGLRPDGSVLPFEANATMVINPPDPDPIWDYRRPSIAAALRAAQGMLARRAQSEPGA